ncbi:hypothetical protein FRB91_010294 [Serendipita sp. 411]|nr:hypothetical protein FRB91_010294 [Serendipita sp. 411]
MVKTAIVDDMDPNIVYSDGWVPVSTTYDNESYEFNSTMHHGSIEGLTISYRFRGTGITVFATLSQPGTYGTPGSTYSIDGGTPVQFNSSGEVILPYRRTYSHVPFYRSPQLSYGDHSILITIDNVSEAARRRYFFDFFAVSGVEDNDNAQGSSGGPGFTIVDDRDARVSFSNGGWLSSGGNSPDYLGTTTTSPTGSGAGSVIFSFTGTSISVYARAINDYGTGNAAEFIIDPGTNQEITQYALVQGTSEKRSLPLLVLEGLVDGEHTIRVNALSQRSWFLDYFVYGTSTGAGVGGLNRAVRITAQGGGGTGTGTVVSTNVTTFMSNGVMVTSTQTILNTGLSLPSPFATESGKPPLENNPAVGSSSSTTQSSPQTKTATIAGAVIGSIALLSLIVFLVLYGLRRRNIKARQSKLEREGIDDDNYMMAGSQMGREGTGTGASSMRSTTPLRNLAGVGIQRNAEVVTIDGDDGPDREEYQQRPNRLAPPLPFAGKSARGFPRDVRQSSGTVASSLLDSDGSSRSSTNDPSSIVPPITTTNRDSQMQNGMLPHTRDGYARLNGTALVEEEEEEEEEGGHGRRGVASSSSPPGQRNLPAVTNELMEKAVFSRSESMQRNSPTQGNNENNNNRRPTSSSHQQRQPPQQQQRDQRRTRPATERVEDVGTTEREIDAGVRLDPLQFNLSTSELLPPSYSATTYR